jgi:hypothetical protein
MKQIDPQVSHADKGRAFYLKQIQRNQDYLQKCEKVATKVVATIADQLAEDSPYFTVVKKIRDLEKE